jgi:hypothetical protein
VGKWAFLDIQYLRTLDFTGFPAFLVCPFSFLKVGKNDQKWAEKWTFWISNISIF